MSRSECTLELHTTDKKEAEVLYQHIVSYLHSRNIASADTFRLHFEGMRACLVVDQPEAILIHVHRALHEYRSRATNRARSVGRDRPIGRNKSDARVTSAKRFIAAEKLLPEGVGASPILDCQEVVFDPMD